MRSFISLQYSCSLRLLTHDGCDLCFLLHNVCLTCIFTPQFHLRGHCCSYIYGLVSRLYLLRRICKRENVLITLSPLTKRWPESMGGAGLWYLWIHLLFAINSASTPKAWRKETHLGARNLVKLFLGDLRVCFTCHELRCLTTTEFVPGAHQEA